MEKRFIEIPELQSHLTERQWDILGSIVVQEPGPRTCARLNITPKTLESHKRNIRDRFGVDDNHSLIMEADRVGVLSKIIRYRVNPDRDLRLKD